MTSVPASHSPGGVAANGLHNERIIVLAPYGQDGRMIADVLCNAARAECVLDMDSFCAELLNCAAAVLTTEALSPGGVGQLRRCLLDQPPWSDLPIVLLANSIDPASYSLLVESLGNVTIIQRPLDPPSLLTVARAALRASHKQRQVRDLLAAGHAQQDQIRALNQRLKRAMTETHHRVKNSLQLISAFVDMQANDYEDFVPVPELKRINTQVRTLAAVHDVLTHTVTERDGDDLVSAKALLEKLFPMLSTMTGAKRLCYEIDEIRLPARQGTSLALIANELILNALKHSGNEVEVSLKSEGSKVILTVVDDGPGLPEKFDVGQASNIGLALVENLARWDLQGEAEYTNREGRSGAKISVEFPGTFADEH